jgi:hypothetical protein
VSDEAASPESLEAALPDELVLRAFVLLRRGTIGAAATMLLSVVWTPFFLWSVSVALFIALDIAGVPFQSKRNIIAVVVGCGVAGSFVLAHVGPLAAFALASENRFTTTDASLRRASETWRSSIVPGVGILAGGTVLAFAVTELASTLNAAEGAAAGTPAILGVVVGAWLYGLGLSSGARAMSRRALRPRGGFGWLLEPWIGFVTPAGVLATAGPSLLRDASGAPAFASGALPVIGTVLVSSPLLSAARSRLRQRAGASLRRLKRDGRVRDG